MTRLYIPTPLGKSSFVCTTLHHFAHHWTTMKLAIISSGPCVLYLALAAFAKVKLLLAENAKGAELYTLACFVFTYRQANGT